MDDNLELLIIFDEVGKGMDDNDELETVDIVLVDERLGIVFFTRVVDIIMLKVCVKLLILTDDLNITDGDEVITERGVLGMTNGCDSLIKYIRDVGVMMDVSNWKNDETERGVVEIKDVIDDCDSKDVISEGVSDLINVIDTTGEGVMMDDFDRDDGVLKTKRDVLELINVSDKINEGIIIDDSKREIDDELEIDVVETINVFDSLIKDMLYDIM